MPGGCDACPWVHAARFEGSTTSQLSNPMTPPPHLTAPQYEGTHNYHNFTVRKPATAGDVKRYILSFRCGHCKGCWLVCWLG